MGATPRQVIFLVLREGLIQAGIGVFIGLAGSPAATPVPANILYGVKPHDALTLGLVALFLLVIAFLATYIPAKRASRLDPVQSLRHE